MNRVIASMLVALLAAPAAAQAPPRPIVPSDFAWQWPLETANADGAVRFTLTPEVYARITRPDLSDLAAFNGADESVPLGPAALAIERLAPPPPPQPVEVALFRVPKPVAADESIELHIARGADGKLSRLDAEIGGASVPAAAQDLLLDLSAIDAPVTSLQVQFDALPAEGVNARVEIAGSDDLARWSTLATNLAVVSLHENGLTLERTALEFPATESPYLRLRRTDTDAALPLRAVQAFPIRRAAVTVVEPARQSFTLQGRALSEEPGSFEYLAAGPYPVERVAIELADRNSVASFVLESRADPSAPWQQRASGTAFRIGGNGEGVSAAPIDMILLRDRHWRVRTQPAQARAPSLAMSYRPDQFVLLTQGAAPYRLAAGSRSARRPDYPLRTVLTQMQSQFGDLWLPPEATLGAGAPLAGDDALTAPPPPKPYKQWLLWGVLIGGALIVIAMVLKLMRAPPAAE